jgi:hypothetical protein
MLERFTLFPVAQREKELIVFADSSECKVTILMLENCGSIRGMDFYLHVQIGFGVHTASNLMGRLPEDICSGVKRLELQTDHSRQSCAGFKNARSFTSVPCA